MRIKLTREGFEKLEKELRFLREVKRPKVIDAIATAREKGDLRENAEYDAAREEQAHLEKRIHELGAQLMSAEVIDDTHMDVSKAFLGSKLRIKDHKHSKELFYTLVSKEEADFKHGKISIESPVGRALLGKSQGETVEVTIPAGTLRYEILEITR